MQLEATDDPFVFDIVQEAEITVDRITIYHDDQDGGPIVLHEGSDIQLDLLSLHDGIVQELVDAQLPVGSYPQLRLHVTSARLVLINGNVYTTEDGTIHLTSQDTSGFKVFVDPPMVIEDGGSARFLLDFDMTHTFHPIPANDPLHAARYQLHPVIHVTNLGHTGGIQGTVTQSDGSGGTTPVEMATVYVLPPGQTDPSQAIATTSTSAQGTYTFLSIDPGTYDVLAVHNALAGSVTGVMVTAGTVAQVDILLGEGGSLQGVVSQSDGAGGTMPVDAATVYVMPPGVTDLSQAVTSGTTNPQGAYTLSGIPTGTYDVIAVKDALTGTVTGVAVTNGAVTHLDVLIQ